jgi:dipeptidyl aminopeptidase/acylaminoacyl peptidase
LEIGFLGMPYRMWNSFINIQPFDFYKTINIPVLFINGEKDTLVSVETTRYIQNNLPGKPFEYIYYKNMGHGPSNYNGVIKLRNDIANWIISNDF